MLILKSSDYYYSGRDQFGRHRFRRKQHNESDAYEMIITDCAKYVYCVGSFEENKVFLFDKDLRPKIPRELLDPAFINPYDVEPQDWPDISQLIVEPIQGTS